MSKLIYLDNAATTKTAPEVLEAMLPYFTEFYGNASTVYDFAANSKAAMAILLRSTASHPITKMLWQNREKESQTHSVQRATKFILQPADQSLTTGHSKQPLRLIRIKENILSQPRSNIMRSCIQQLIWKNVGLK